MVQAIPGMVLFICAIFILFGKGKCEEEQCSAESEQVYAGMMGDRKCIAKSKLGNMEGYEFQGKMGSEDDPHFLYCTTEPWVEEEQNHEKEEEIPNKDHKNEVKDHEDDKENIDKKAESQSAKDKKAESQSAKDKKAGSQSAKDEL